jgi:rhamnosyltransferase
MKRLLLYVHFNKENELSSHVRYQLQALSAIYNQIILISNSQLEQAAVEELPIADFLQRNNQGYDFAAWADGMKMLGFDALKEYDSVTIMNDTTFGPIFDFEPIVERMEKSENDFWGLTNHRAHDADILGQLYPLKEHIQSYFISFKQALVAHPSFQAFWGTIQSYEDVNQVILNYETTLTDYFNQAGFKYGVQFDTVAEDSTAMQNSDFSIFGLRQLIAHQVPFVKVKAFMYNAEKPEIKMVFDKILASSDYPSSLIIDHMTFADYPDRNYMLSQKTLDFRDVKLSQVRVAVHLHVSSEDKLDLLLSSFDQFLPAYDLYLTTSLAEVVDKLRQSAKAVVLVEQDLSAILAWQQIQDKLASYAFAVHFEMTAIRDAIDSLIKPAQKIVTHLLANEKIGLVMSDRYELSQYDPMQAEMTWPDMARLWNTIYPNNEKNLKKQEVYVKSATSSFWYRPQALEKLSAIDLGALMTQNPSDVKLVTESLSNLLTYAAWANGFDFRLTQAHLVTGFEKQRLFASQVEAAEVVHDVPPVQTGAVRRLIAYAIRRLKNIVKHLKN